MHKVMEMQYKRGSKRYEMRPILNTFQSRLFERKGRPLVKLYHLQQQWTDIVGEYIAQKSFPQMLDRGKLIIAVENSTLAQQLNMLKIEIKKRIEVSIGEEITDVKCVQQTSGWNVPPPVYTPKPVFKLSRQELNENRDRSLEEILQSTWSKLQALKHQK